MTRSFAIVHRRASPRALRPTPTSHALRAWFAVVLASLAVGDARPAAAQPSPLTSTAPAYITLVGAKAGVADPAGAFIVTVKDLANQPIAGTAVRIAFGGCADVVPAATQPAPGLTSDCSARTVSATTDGQGVAHFDIAGAVLNRASASGPACAEVRADPGDVLLGTVTVSCADQDGYDGANTRDAELVLCDVLSGLYRGRSDLDHNGVLSPADYSTEQNLVAAGNSTETAARCDGVPANTPTLQAEGGGLDLGWSACRSDGGSGATTFTCPTSGGSLPALVGSTVAPLQAGAVSGFDAVVEIVCQPGTTLPGWWQFQSGGCRAGALTVGPPAGVTCTDPFGGSAALGSNVTYPAGAANVERVEITGRSTTPAALTAGTAYELFDVHISKPAITSTCLGCTTPVLLRFVSLTLRQDATGCSGGAPAGPRLHQDAPAHDNLVTAQGPVTGVTPTIPAGLALWLAGGAPAHGRVVVACTIRDGRGARLTLVDVSGRTLAARALDHSGTVTLADDMRPGVYWARLAQDRESRSMAVVVVR